MIGSLIGGAVQLAGSIFGGIQAAKAARKRKESVERRKQENQAWYDRRYNEDATQRADAQRLLTMTKDAIRERNRSAAGRQAVMGGTDSSVAAEKARNAQMLGNTVSQINAQGEARKDRIESQYLGRKDSLDNALENIEQNKANQITKAAEGVGKAGAAIGVAIDTPLDEGWDNWKKKKEDS